MDGCGLDTLDRGRRRCIRLLIPRWFWTAPDGDLVVDQLLRRELQKVGSLEDDWTYLRLVVGVPPGPVRFNYSPERNTVVCLDAKGERYGNVYTRGPLQRLPDHVRGFFVPKTVEPGERYEGVLLFRPTLKPSEVDEVSMFVGGRLQRFFVSN